MAKIEKKNVFANGLFYGFRSDGCLWMLDDFLFIWTSYLL